jgi:membrane peptidoglycan carboxypeptidase
MNDLLAPLSQLYEQLGADIIWQTASSFGLGDQALEAPNQIFYHQNTASLIEIAQLYNTFASLGTRYGVRSAETGIIEPVLYQRVETTDGQVLCLNCQPAAGLPHPRYFTR